jgi:glycosyltransferase involved in cell wall biosynthesis
VVAFRRGSMMELVQHGVTGFLVDDIEAAVTAVGEVVDLDRPRIRAQAVARFGRARMIDEYLHAYERLIA